VRNVGKSYRALVVKPEGHGPLERLRNKWEDNIKEDLQEVGWGMNWIDLAQDSNKWRALLRGLINLWVP
jgi:hypothetical protein